MLTGQERPYEETKDFPFSISKPKHHRTDNDLHPTNTKLAYTRVRLSHTTHTHAHTQQQQTAELGSISKFYRKPSGADTDGADINPTYIHYT